MKRNFNLTLWEELSLQGDGGAVRERNGLKQPRVLALEVTGWMDAALGARCSCASPLSASRFSVIIEREMMGVVQRAKNVPQTESAS